MSQVNDELVVYCDADFAGDKESRRSTSGHISLLNGNAISWSSSIQRVTALSTTESEYMALTDALRDILWLRLLLKELGAQQKSPTVIHVDNQGAIALSRNPEFQKRTKHIVVKYHRVREEQETGTIDIAYVETNEQLADFLTKCMGGKKLRHFMEQMELTKFD